MKAKIAIGTETFAVVSLDIVQGHVDQKEVAWQAHRRGRNWAATVRFDPSAPNCLARNFWKRASGSYVAVPPSLAPGDLLEFGADYYTAAGHRHEHREYRRVLAVAPERIVLRESGKPGRRPLRPLALDIAAAEIGDVHPAPGPLADASTADLIAELKRRGVNMQAPEVLSAPGSSSLPQGSTRGQGDPTAIPGDPRPPAPVL